MKAFYWIDLHSTIGPRFTPVNRCPDYKLFTCACAKCAVETHGHRYKLPALDSSTLIACGVGPCYNQTKKNCCTYVSKKYQIGSVILATTLIKHTHTKILLCTHPSYTTQIVCQAAKCFVVVENFLARAKSWNSNGDEWWHLTSHSQLVRLTMERFPTIK